MIQVSQNTAISVQQSSVAPYVAVSHVWSDGLGNPRNNTLPECQLERLQKYVNALYPQALHPIAFWIDTISVPLRKDLRRIAIWRMAETYKAADKVLVIDDWLLQTDFTGNASLDLLKVKSCDWAKRLWTLQESLLTQRDQLYFQSSTVPVHEWTVVGRGDRGKGISWMAGLVGSSDDSLCQFQCNTALTMLQALNDIPAINAKVSDNPAYEGLLANPDPDSAWANARKMLRTVDSWYEHNFIWVEGRDFFLDMRGQTGRKVDTPVQEANAIIRIGYSLRFRSTSWVEDEAICYATLLGQDPQAILGESSTQDKMTAVVKKMKNVPISLLFSSMPRIDKVGLRWAPLSFRIEQNSGKARDPGYTFVRIGQVLSAGLLVSLEALAMERVCDRDLAPDFHIDIGSRSFSVNVRRRVSNVTVVETNGNLALVLAWAAESLTSVRSDAVLVNQNKCTRKTTFATLLALCTILPLEHTENTDHEQGQRIAGHVLPQRQWCIG